MKKKETDAKKRTRHYPPSPCPSAERATPKNPVRFEEDGLGVRREQLGLAVFRGVKIISGSPSSTPTHAELSPNHTHQEKTR